MKYTIALLFSALILSTSYAQSDSTVHLYIANDSFIVRIDKDTNGLTPIFIDTNINNIANKYHFTVFEKELPTSRIPDVRQFYKIVCDNTAIAQELANNFPNVFYNQGIGLPVVLTSTHTPDDWHGSWLTNPWALDYIFARKAWALVEDAGIIGARGNSSILIGINDSYFGPYHPDLMSKYAQIDNNVGVGNHGTFVAGMAAAQTNNGIGYPGVSYNCKLRVYAPAGNESSILAMSNTAPKVKVINCSWSRSHENTLDLISDLNYRLCYDEIYQNGVTTCFAAGNGTKTKPGDAYWEANYPSNYNYPSSYDHIISTTHIGSRECSWVEDGGGTGASCDEHNIVSGDTLFHAPGNPTAYSIENYNHNPRVDICAPAYQVGGLIYNLSLLGDDRFYASSRNGTSFASPQTAGVVALMASVCPCLSPYQMEYNLKLSARDEIYAKPDNAYVASPKRLGAGALNAFNALSRVGDNPSSYDACNDPASQTFYIAGIEFNTKCAPGYSSNGVKPILTPILVNGTPPYTYRWEAYPGNTTTLNSLTSNAPTVTSSTTTHLAYYYLTVYDNSPIQKVANRLFKIKLLAGGMYELASRDSYMDMLDEPNNMATLDPRDENIFLSPDIWNRLSNDAGTTPENVEYFTSAPNYMKIRVRNVGCAPYTTGNLAYVRGYWTFGGTAENWPTHWTTDNITLPGGGSVPRGREITPITGSAIPYLEPGASFISTMPWYPVNPDTYPGIGHKAEVCGLSRIIDPSESDNDITFTETINTGTNVRNNNNIITRNMGAVNLGRKKSTVDLLNIDRTKISRVFVGNQNTNKGAVIRLNMITDKDIHLHFAGNPSKYMNVEVKLEDGLWNSWANGGFAGNYFSYDQTTKTVIYDPVTPLMLDNISLDTNSFFYVDLAFKLRDEVKINAPFASQMFHFRQLKDTTDEVIGSVSFLLNIKEDDTTTRKGVLAVTEFSEGSSTGCQYAELVVANCGTNMANQVDIRGWLVNDNSGLILGSSCNENNVNRGHLRFAHDDVWARVPVGSTIMLYNYSNNCYNLSDTFYHDSTNGQYWIPVGASSNLHLESFPALENADSCAYCSDTGTTQYSVANNWKQIQLDPIFDAIEVACPGCTNENPQPLRYFVAGHIPTSHDSDWEVSTFGVSNVGTVFITNSDSSYGFKYRFCGNTDREILDPTKWIVSLADEEGTTPSSLGIVNAAFQASIKNHETNFPCCASNSSLQEKHTPSYKNTGSPLAANRLRIYPNPTNTLLHFEFAASQTLNIKIIDLTGRVVETQTIHNSTNATFDVHDYTPGLYLYEVSNGNRKEVGKVVIGIK